MITSLTYKNCFISVSDNTCKQLPRPGLSRSLCFRRRGKGSTGPTPETPWPGPGPQPQTQPSPAPSLTDAGQRREVIKWLCKATVSITNCVSISIYAENTDSAEMWTRQRPSCYWSWRMQDDWLRPSQRSESVTTTDCEKPTQRVSDGMRSGLGGGGVTSYMIQWVG